MKQAWNIIWKLALAMGAVGTVLTLVGLKIGWPQPVAWGPHGPQVVDVRDVTVSEDQLAPFDKIAVDVAILDVKVVQGDHYGLRIHAPSTYLDITWTDENGTLTITQKNSPVIMGFGFGGSWTAVVTVPSSATLTSVDITDSAGDITLAAPATTVALSTSVGDVRLAAPAGKATVRTQAGNTRVEADVKDLVATSSTGDVVVRGNSGSVRAETSSGNVTVQGSATAVDATTSTGDVTVTLTAPWAATTYKVRTSLGDVRFAGPGAPPSDDRSTQVASPELTLTATTSAGNIRVTLGA